MDSLSLDTVRAMDAADPLSGFRDRFFIPDGLIYLDGNSLGALPKATRDRLADVIGREWGHDLIRSWNDNGWIEAPARVGAKISALIGAKPDEVIVADSTSVNLYKLIMAALAARPGRRVVLSEPGNFPTDLYIVQGSGCELRLASRDWLIDAIDDNVALVLLTQVHYKSAAVHDMAAITRAAHAKGAMVLWDLSHSAGAIQVDLNGCGADLAVGCGYKYLNGGPGAPAFLFVAERHHSALSSPLTGWMGHARPFDFIDAYEPAGGIARFLCGTPPILGVSALEVGVDLIAEAGMARLAAKSRRLSQLFIDLVGAFADEFGLMLVSPADPERRGSHVSYAHPAAYPVCQALIARGIIGDFRAPDVLRLGFTPLYLRYEDVWQAAAELRSVLADRSWDQPLFHRRAPGTRWLLGGAGRLRIPAQARPQQVEREARHDEAGCCKLPGRQRLHLETRDETDS